MLWPYSGLLLAYITSVLLAQPNKTKTCLKAPNKTSYTCEPNQMIHVISKIYQEASEDCKVPNDACEVTEDSLSNGLTTECNGKVTCTEDISLLQINKTCENISAAMVTTLYECISDPQVNVCSSQVSSIGTHTLYLISPNFPEKSNAGNIDRACECDITGTDLSVEILEINFFFNQDVRANLTLTGDFSSWESYPETILMYNQKIINKTNGLHVMFHAYNRNSQHMWIRIIGTTNVTTQCNYVAPPTTSPSSTSPISSPVTNVTITIGTPIKSRSTSISPGDTKTDRLDRTQTAESNTVAVAVSCVFAVLVVAALIIVIIFIMMRRKRLKPYLRSQDDEGSTKHIEAYQMSLASRETLDNNLSDNGHGPPCPDYADVEPLSSRKADTGDTKVQNSKSYRTSRGPQSSDYAEVTPLRTTETGNRDRHPTPHYFVLQPLGTTKTDVGHGSSLSGASRGQAGSEYAEPYTLDISKTYAEQKNSLERGSGDPSTPNKSSVPYTSKRLEELNAKVVPKKFRSTRDMREAEKKTNAKESKIRRKSDTNAKGITNDAYDGGDEKTAVKHGTKTKERRSWSKSDPDYQETANVSVSQCDSEVSPPVPPEADGILNELGTAKEPGNQEPDLSSENNKTNKNRKKRTSASDTMKTPEAGTNEETQVKSGTDSDSKVLCRPGTGANTSAYGTDSDDKLLVDNVLYVGTDGHVQSRTGANSKVPSGPGKGTNRSADDSGDKPIMVDNVLYEGTDGHVQSRTGANSKVPSGPGKGTNMSADNSDDKPIMVPNVLYEGTGRHVQSRTGTNSKVPSGPGKGTNMSADDSDDKPVMVPNVLYEGTGADLNTRNGDLDSTHGKSSHQAPQGSEYEDVKDDRTSSRPRVICDTRAGGPSPYEEIVI